MLFGKVWETKMKDNVLQKLMRSHWFWIYLFVIFIFTILTFIDFIKS